MEYSGAVSANGDIRVRVAGETSANLTPSQRWLAIASTVGLTLCFLLAACGKLAPEPRPAKAKLTLSGGEEIIGLIQQQTDSEIRIMTDKGLRVVPASQVLLVQLEGEKPVNHATPVAVPQRSASLLEHFQPPAAGRLRVSPGATLSVRLSQRITDLSTYPHQILNGEITSELPARPVIIPDGSIVVLEVMATSPGIVLGLSAVNINGHQYRVSGGRSLVLGAVVPEPGSGQKAGAGISLSTGTVISWRLRAEVVLREEKQPGPTGL